MVKILLQNEKLRSKLVGSKPARSRRDDCAIFSGFSLCENDNSGQFLSKVHPEGISPIAIRSKLAEAQQNLLLPLIFRSNLISMSRSAYLGVGESRICCTDHSEIVPGTISVGLRR